MNKDYWILTNSGKKFYFLDPQPDQICIEDIAHALSHICRFNGQADFFYSVAEHSMMCASMAEPEDKFAALMHDGSEYVAGDVVRPLKQLLPEYKKIEKNIERVIQEKYNFATNDRIKHIDMRMLKTEKLMCFGQEAARHCWSSEIESLEPYKCDFYLNGLPPLEIKKQFLILFSQLYKSQ